MDLVKGMDAESRRAAEEGLTEDQYAPRKLDLTNFDEDFLETLLDVACYASQISSFCT
jgi:hypothetical protein